jgi:hypothetical protein
MSKLLAALLLILSTSVNAYTTEQLPDANGSVQVSHDSDDYNTIDVTVGSSFENGAGVRLIYENTTAPGFDANSDGAQVTYVKSSDDWKVRGSAGSKNTRFTGGEHSTFIGDITLEAKVTDKITVEGFADYNVVDTSNSIINNVRSALVGVSIDYLITDDIVYTMTTGATFFTDDNTRTFFRNKLSYTVLPEYGISIYGKTVNRWDSNEGSKNYWSPNRFSSQVVGAKIRKSYSGLMWTAQYDLGSQQVEDAFYVKSHNAIHSWLLQVDTKPNKKAGYTFGVTAIGTDVNAARGGEDNYYWTGINAWLKIPL